MSVRLVLFVVAFTASALALPALLFQAVETFGVKPVQVGLDAFARIRPGLAEVSRGSDADRWDVAYLGDSTVVSYPKGRRVPQRLQEAVSRLGSGAPPIRVHSVAAPGMGSFDFYFVADEVVAAAPDQVILPFNLTSLSDAWRGTFSRPELAGWISPSRVPEALGLPLEWMGLTADRLLFYVGVVNAGGGEFLHTLLKEQARLGRARKLVNVWLAERLSSTADIAFGRALMDEGEERIFTADKQRLSAWGVRQRFGRALDGVDRENPVLRVLGASVSRFRRAGIDVLVYTNPTNLEHVEAAGLSNEKGLARTVSAIAATVRDAGGEFAPLHALIPDSGFRDPAGHLSVEEGLPDGPRALAEALAPSIVEQARGARRPHGPR